jgi:hypothetical protein
MQEKINLCKTLTGNLKVGKRPLGGLGRDVRLSEKYGMKMWTGLNWLKIWSNGEILRTWQ